MKYLIALFIFFLPFHAILITFLKCKIGVNTDILRFWKEFVIIILFLISVGITLVKNKFSISKILKDNYLVGTIIAFSICSFIYIFFPFFEIKISAFLGFKYDTFFLFAIIIGLYLVTIGKNFDFLLKTLFVSIGSILIIFLPWYLFGDISNVSNIFGYSNKVSTYEANSCISFAQNVEGQHRFQATFGGPISFSVFLVVFYILYLGFILNQELKNKKNKTYLGLSFILLLIIPTILIITSIFFSYTKTSILGLIFGLALFIYLIRKIIFDKKINTKLLYIISGIGLFGISFIVYLKRELFLHLGSVINRFDNIVQSIEMFFYNPFGYGLGIAGPATQIGNTIESVGGIQIAANATAQTFKFLPENWYIQILLEQGIVGLGLFLGILFIIGFKLYDIVKLKKDYLSIAIFSAFMSLCFMANFTHAFEESGTSYILFLIIGAYIAINKSK